MGQERAINPIHRQHAKGAIAGKVGIAIGGCSAKNLVGVHVGLSLRKENGIRVQLPRGVFCHDTGKERHLKKLVQPLDQVRAVCFVK